MSGHTGERAGWLAVGLALGLAVGAAADDILLRDGKRIAGVKVTAESLAEVKYTDRGGKAGAVTPGWQVQAILREETPEPLENGQRFLNQGDFQGAAQEFRTATTATGGQAWAAEYAWMGLGDARRLHGLRAGDNAALEEALQAYDKVVETNATSRFLVEVQLRKGHCHRLLKKFDQAVAAYEAAKSAASANSLGDEPVQAAALGAAWTKLESGDSAGAKAAFDAVAGASSQYPALAREALSGWSEAAIAGGETGPVKAKMTELAGKARDRRDLAVAHNGIGAALFAEKGYAEALNHFVRVVGLYFSDPQEYARALYYAGRCYVELKEQDAETYRNVYWKELRSRFPASTWAVRAR